MGRGENAYAFGEEGNGAGQDPFHSYVGFSRSGWVSLRRDI